MTFVWLSPGLPADRAELAAALPPEVTLVPAQSATGPAADPAESSTAADVGVLPVGSLCVATVFEHDLLAELATRPAGVRLLVVGPADRLVDSPNATAPQAGRPADVVTAAASVPELVAAIGRAINGAIGSSPTSPYLPHYSPIAPAAEGLPAKAPTPLRTRLVATAAVLLGLAVGGVVIGTTEGTSSATANGGAGGFGGFPGGGGQFPGGGAVPGGAGGTGGTAGTGAPGGTTIEKQILACLRQQGIKTPTSQLLQNQQDPALRQAFLTCIQQLRNGGTGTAGAPGTGPGGPSSQITGRP